MAEFIVHSVPGSPYGRAVFVALEEKHATYRIAPVANEHRKREPHLYRHPFARVPVLEHDGFLLYETQAILRYLDRTLPTPSLTPAEPQAAARMDQVMNVCDWYLFQGVANVIGFERVVRPRLLGQPTDEAAVAAAMPRAQTVFKELSRLLGVKSWFAADTISLADIQVAPQLDFMRQTPEWGPLTAATPNLVDWLDRMTSRPSFAATTWERIAALAAA